MKTKKLLAFNMKKISVFLLATCHGKGAADGMRLRVNRLVAKASLSVLYKNQIIPPHEPFNSCNSNIHNITFFMSKKIKFLTIRKNL
jgi:hypothetical protein